MSAAPTGTSPAAVDEADAPRSGPAVIGRTIRAVLAEPRKLTAVGAALLGALMFLPWYGTKEVVSPGGFTLPARDVTVNAFRSFEAIDIFLVLAIAVIGGAAYLVLRRPESELRGVATVLATGAALLALALVAYRFIVPLTSTEREIGLFLALPTALVTAYGAFRWLREEPGAVADARRRLARLIEPPGGDRG